MRNNDTKKCIMSSADVCPALQASTVNSVGTFTATPCGCSPGPCTSTLQYNMALHFILLYTAVKRRRRLFYQMFLEIYRSITEFLYFISTFLRFRCICPTANIVSVVSLPRRISNTVLSMFTSTIILCTKLSCRRETAVSLCICVSVCHYMYMNVNAANLAGVECW